MKKFFAVFAMVCAVALFVGCAEEPVEEEVVTEEQPVEVAPESEVLAPETDTDMMDTAMTDTTMTDEGAMMNDTATDTVAEPEVE